MERLEYEKAVAINFEKSVHYQLIVWSDTNRKGIPKIKHFPYYNYINVCMHIYRFISLRGYSTPGPKFLKTLCIFSQNKATLDKITYGSGQKCSKELKNYSFTSVETIVAKLQ